MVEDIFALLVLKMKLPPHYVLYEMDRQELDALMRNAEYVNRDEMEMLRLNAYINAQANSKQRLKPTDICRFGWDNKVEKAVNVTAEERRKLAEKAQQYKKYL